MAASERIELSHGSFVLQLEPAIGGCIAGFWMDGIAVLRSTAAPDALESVRLSASYPLVPFSNRIGYGTFDWMGERHALAANFLPEPHAIHGIGWQRPWQVIGCSASSAQLLLCHRLESPNNQAAWPFAFDCVQTFALNDSGLHMELALTNRESQRSMPAGLGFHPYFVKRPGSHIRFAATGQWEMDSANLPTQRNLSPGLDTDCAHLQIDHCFDGVGVDLDAAVHLQDSLLESRITSNVQHLVVYTQPGRDFIAIEPVSHANNALGMHTAEPDMAALQSRGVKILHAGETLTVYMQIDMRRTTHNPKEF